MRERAVVSEGASRRAWGRGTARAAQAALQPNQRPILPPLQALSPWPRSQSYMRTRRRSRVLLPLPLGPAGVAEGSGGVGAACGELLCMSSAATC